MNTMKRNNCHLLSSAVSKIALVLILACCCTVMLFAQDCKDKDLTMLRGGGCEVYTDFTSAVYNCVWDAVENDR